MLDGILFAADDEWSCHPTIRGSGGSPEGYEYDHDITGWYEREVGQQ